MSKSSPGPKILLAAVAATLLSLSACKRPENEPAPTTGANETTAPAPDTPTALNTPPSTSAAASSANPDGQAVAAAATGASHSSTVGAPGDLIDKQPTAAGIPPASGPLNADDRKFVTEAAGGGLYEVAVAKLATEKATDPQVKSFASMLVDHHTQANEKLKQVATSKGVELPSALPADKQKELDQLSKVEGAAFDQQFVQIVGVKDHKANIALFEKASKTAKDTDVKAFAETTLPTLKSHLSAAEKLPAKKG
jgi:putative membrane protein